MPLLNSLSDLPMVLSRLGLLSLSYWLLSLCIEREGLWRLAIRLKLTHPAWSRAVGIGALLFLSLVFDWTHVVPHPALGEAGGAEENVSPAVLAIRVLGVGLAALLTWKMSTTDLDVVGGESHIEARILLLAGTLAFWWNPAWVVLPLLLLTRPFRQWRHHAILPMRSLLAVAAYVWVRQLVLVLPASAPLFLPDPAMLLFFLFTLHSSHYLSAGLAKLTLGPRWWSWLLENPLHFLPANAYAWGWARFIPWKHWLKVIQLVRVFRIPFLLLTLALEILAPLSLLSPETAIAAGVMWSGFHVMVFLMTGLCFWDWILANTLLLGCLLWLPLEQQHLFGWPAVLLSTLFIFLIPLKNRLWGPIMLGWWETPLTQRMHWIAEGRSGQRYEVHNQFMCPHERLYGVVHALFMAPVPLLSYDMGSIWESEARRAIERAVLGQQPVEEVRERFGVQPRHPEWEASHTLYLQRFFAALNRGAKKHILPRPLRWLKAPGGHLYSWGALPPYRRQEPVSRIFLYFRELAFDGATLQLWRDELVRTIPIDETAASSCAASASAPGESSPQPREPYSRDVERFISEAFWRAAQTWNTPQRQTQATNQTASGEG